MSTLEYPGSSVERRIAIAPQSPRRRFGDSVFIRLRWSVLLSAWAIGGVAFLVYVVERLLSAASG